MTLLPPTAFPAPGTYAVEQRVALIAPADTTIHYTIDGTTPTTASPVLAADGFILLEAVNDGDRGLTITTTIRAITARAGQVSAAALFV
ncbi:MAG: chitobiase/beta-hexosaminidase C-terminal domain-containing protein, partial [Roseiflexaceae bacterium]